jgi:hypothetical protein
MAEKIFTEGMIVKAPRQGAPDFVKGALAFRTQEFVHWLEDHTKADGWCNVDILEGKSGKWYGSVNTWTKDTEKVEDVQIDTSESPF